MGLSETQNLTVVLRVRPPNEPHVGKDRIVHVLDGQMVILTDPRDEDDILRAKRSREKRYMFDIAFDSYNTQLDVYLATTKPLISSVLDGFNATVFAYGPTGTGKTYTMLGTGDNPGIMALALNEIFSLVRKGMEHSTFTVTMSYLEVYNELIRDLLCPDSGDLELREDNSGVTVAGLTEVETQSTREVMDMLRDGNKLRTTEPTSVNKTSSRSHAVLQVTVKRLKRVRALSETVTTGKLYMIDLAGSERATHTKNRGTRLVEGAHINRSLLALGNCIKALSNSSSSYVNYRDSKLTRLLKDSLGGNCRTAMIAHVSPDHALFDESRNTLQYADRAKRIKTKIRPNLQTVSHHIAKYPIIVEELHKEIARLKKLNTDKFDTQSLESTSGILPITKDREIMEEKRSSLNSVYDKQLKFKTRLSRLEGQQKMGGHKTGHLQSLLTHHMEGRALYSVLPPIKPDMQPEAHRVETEQKEIEIRSALRRMSARKRREDSSHEKLISSWSKLADKYRAVEEDIEDKVCDEDHREILGLLSNVHGLELQLAGAREDVQSLENIIKEQGHWLKSHYNYNLELLEVVRCQHDVLQSNSVALTPELQELYRRIQERSMEEYEILPRIRSAMSSVSDVIPDTPSLSDDTPPATPADDVTPVFMKTYNVTGKEGCAAGASSDMTVERDLSHTTIHVLSTPSLTAEGRESPSTSAAAALLESRPRTKQSEGEGRATSINSAVLAKGSSTELAAPNTASSPAPGKQAKKAIQVQRLRSLRTEPVIAPKQRPRDNKNYNTKTYNKNALIKSDTHLKIAEKTKIYGGVGTSRTPQTRGRKQVARKKANNLHLAVSGTNKNFPVKVFR